MKTADKERVGDDGNKQSAKRCGLATTLSYLCYRDLETEASIKGTDNGYGFEMELNTNDPNKKEKVELLKRIIDVKCNMVFKIIVEANPIAGARGYVNAALDAGYEHLIIFNVFR